MSGILLFLIGLSTLIFIAIAVAIWWAVRSGQFEDMEGPAQRILMDDDDPLLPQKGGDRGLKEKD
jgi:cbb3-type cytochrome oxidase maturation protein